LVSVIIPTIGRPVLLGKAVRSVLRQEVPPGWDLEVILGVSNPQVAGDVEAATALAGEDQRVRVALGPARGAAATRNAAIAEAGGSVFAFMDDDCQAQPGWLVAGLEAIESADLVQGTTRPEGDVPDHFHSVWVTPPSWLWETCNLVVRREWIERVGGFNEGWNEAGHQSNLFQFGEDVEIGWKMLRAGARLGTAPEALVHHAVVPRGYVGYLAYKAGIHRFPRLFRSTPEARRIFYRGYFVNQRHVALSVCAGLGLASLAARAAGRGSLSTALGLAAGATYLAPVGGELAKGHVDAAIEDLARRVPLETIEFACAVYGSIRWRRLLL
jgi:glycosyltransferase involved in cell wall biosynthesis